MVQITWTTSMARVHWRTHHGDTSTRHVHWDDVPVLLNDLHDSGIVEYIEVKRQEKTPCPTPP